MSGDAHNAAHIGRGFDTIKEILIDIGFKYTVLPWSKKRVKIS